MESNCTEPQSVTLDVMPLVAGYLPLPTVRLSKYIAANSKGTLLTCLYQRNCRTANRFCGIL